MSEVKPIETFYNGYRFRSRLEARWAVFFDAAGIKYEYESEGYEFDGERYLPDFYLPDFDIHAEVKGNRPNVDKDIAKCVKMIKWGGAIKAILFLGEVPTLDIKNGGHWHFPILCYQTGIISDEVVPKWLYFEDNFDDEGDSIGVAIAIPHTNYPDPFYIDCDGSIYGRWDTITRKHLNVSVNPVTDFELRNEPQVDEIIRQMNIEFVLDRNKLFYAALQKARQARFEYGEKG